MLCCCRLQWWWCLTLPWCCSSSLPSSAWISTDEKTDVLIFFAASTGVWTHTDTHKDVLSFLIEAFVLLLINSSFYMFLWSLIWQWTTITHTSLWDIFTVIPLDQNLITALIICLPSWLFDCLSVTVFIKLYLSACQSGHACWGSDHTDVQTHY